MILKFENFSKDTVERGGKRRINSGEGEARGESKPIQRRELWWWDEIVGRCATLRQWGDDTGRKRGPLAFNFQGATRGKGDSATTTG